MASRCTSLAPPPMVPWTRSRYSHARRPAEAPSSSAPEKSGAQTWRVRYRREDGTIGAINGFPGKTAASQHAAGMESEQHQGRFIDPAAGKTTLRVWSQDWLGGIDVAVRTEDFYRSLLRRHILPRWGEHGLADISGIKAAAWAKQLRDQGYSPVTVTSVMKLLSLLLSDAVDERLIPVNPIRARHRGRRRSDRRVERLWATPSQVLAVADNIARLPTAGTGAELLVVTAAWTGARWGEIAALQRRNTHLDDGVIVIDPLLGAMIESSRGIALGPPKDRGVRPHDHPAPLPDPPPAGPPRPPRPSARVHLPSRGTAPAQQLWTPRAAPGHRRHRVPGRAAGAAGTGQTRADVSRAAPQPQDLDDRRRRPRSRPIPTAGSHPGRPYPGDLLPRRRRSRTPSPRGPQRSLGQSRRRQP